MSENKVVLGDRTTKKITLPESKAEVEVYASILVQDMGGFDLKKFEDEKSNSITDAIILLTRLIKSWNVYETKDAKEPREINVEAVSLLPAKDLTFLFEELKGFVTSEKKE